MLETQIANKLKAFCAGLLLVATAAPAFAADPTVTSVKAALNRIRGSGSSSFCYAIENGEVQGINEAKPVKIASVMKLMTTFWAIEKLGSPNFRWRTKIYYSPSRGEMHIEGSNDPFFHRDRLYLLLSDLNRNNIRALNRITADQNFRIGMSTVDVSYHVSEDARNSSMNRVSENDLIEAFNTNGWWSSRKGTYARIRSENRQQTMLPEISFKVGTAQVTNVNPLKGLPDVKVFEVRSAPLRYYLKRMNIMSANPMADELYYALGGTAAFKVFMDAKYHMASAVEGVYSGSGLWVGPPRRDTTMPCSAVVRIIRRMDQDLERVHGMDLADVMMVAGLDVADGPTYTAGGQTLIVKTGTVNGAKNLAGSMSTSQGEVYFGIFMQGAAGSGGPRSRVVDAFVGKYKRNKVTGRKTFRFDALDNEMYLRPFGGPAPQPAPYVAPPSTGPKVEEIVVTARRPVKKPAAKPVARAAAKPAPRRAAAKRAVARKPAPKRAVARKPAPKQTGRRVARR
jgi:serine-type D-Ala-D-Ala carboxypeptidase/endopeptidase (penicillin-binding protein 4)